MTLHLDDSLAPGNLLPLDSVRRLVGAAFLAAHLGLSEQARAVLAAAAAAAPRARYLPLAQAYVCMLTGDNDGAMRHLDSIDLFDGSTLADDARMLLALVAKTGGYGGLFEGTVMALARSSDPTCARFGRELAQLGGR